MLLVVVPVLRAQDGVQGALAKFNRTSALVEPLTGLHGPTLAVADLDGDGKPDGAILLASDDLRGLGNFDVELHFTHHSNTDIRFQSADPAITVEALDIDHDGDIDLIIEQSLTRKRLQVWINDGHGNFEKGRMEDFPSAVAPTRDQIRLSEHLDYPAVSLPTQRGFETMLMACHIAGRPPSESDLATSSTTLFRPDHAASLTHSRAPPLT